MNDTNLPFDDRDPDPGVLAETATAETNDVQELQSLARALVGALSHPTVHDMVYRDHEMWIGGKSVVLHVGDAEGGKQILNIMVAVPKGGDKMSKKLSVMIKFDPNALSEEYEVVLRTYGPDSRPSMDVNLGAEGVVLGRELSSVSHDLLEGVYADITSPVTLLLERFKRVLAKELSLGEFLGGESTEVGGVSGVSESADMSSPAEQLNDAGQRLLDLLDQGIKGGSITAERGYSMELAGGYSVCLPICLDCESSDVPGHHREKVPGNFVSLPIQGPCRERFLRDVYRIDIASPQDPQKCPPYIRVLFTPASGSGRKGYCVYSTSAYPDIGQGNQVADLKQISEVLRLLEEISDRLEADQGTAFARLRTRFRRFIGAISVVPETE